MKRKLMCLLLFSVAATAHAQLPSPLQARAQREMLVMKVCSEIADLKANVLELRRKGADKATARQYVADQLGAIPGISIQTIKGFQSSVNEIYAIPPLKSHQEVIGVRGIIFNQCVEGMLSDPT